MDDTPFGTKPRAPAEGDPRSGKHIWMKCADPVWRKTVKTLFVSGVEGFVGQHLTRLLVDSGYTVVGGVRNRARKLAFEKKFGKALVCDVSDAINVARVIASVQPDGVIHLAGTSQPHVANDEPLEAYQSIVSGWANVLDAVRRTNPRARIVMISSSEVYGNAGNDAQPLTETSPCNPVSTFGALKFAAESIAHTYFENYHLNVSIARPFQALGPNEPVGSFFGWVGQQIAGWDPLTSGSTLEVPDLECRRDILHVHDIARAYQTLLEQGRPNETYNVCSGQTRSVAEIAQAMVRTAGKQINLVAPATEEAPRIHCLCGDNTKLSSLGWQPTRSFDQAITDLIESYAPAGVTVG